MVMPHPEEDQKAPVPAIMPTYEEKDSTKLQALKEDDLVQGEKYPSRGVGADTAATTRQGGALLNVRTNDDVPELDVGAHALAAEERQRIEKRLKRKLDFGMLPIVILVYILNYLDRNSISQARLSGLEDDLSLSDPEYQNALSLLFVFYILMQVPSNAALAWCGRPSLYIGTFVVLWGAVSACTGAVHNYGQLVAVRLLLGAVEAPFFPGCMFLLSKWYTKTELSTRMALLYAGSILSNAISGLISAGILDNMEGVHGLAGWRWLFILEGCITAGLGLIVMFILPNFPHNTKTWFTDEELRVAVQRLAEDVGETDVEAEQGSAWEGFLLSIKDPKVYLLTLMLFSCVVGVSFNAFMPTIVKTLGYGKIETLLLTCPVWLFAFLAVYFNALHADRTGERFLHISIPMVVGITGFIIAASTQALGARMFAMFIFVTSYAGYVIILSWISSTIPRPTFKRSVSMALINCIANTGNLAGGYLFPTSWGPTYWRSFLVTAICFCVSIASAFVLRCMLKNMNKELERTRGGSAPEKLATRVNGDEERSSGEVALTDEQRILRARENFRYLL